MKKLFASLCSIVVGIGTGFVIVKILFESCSSEKTQKMENDSLISEYRNEKNRL